MSSPSDRTKGELPAVDEHLVASEVRYEIDDGKLVYVPPALEPHGEAHGALAALLWAHAADEYKVAIDMLTRTSETTDIAPDASVYPAARDPTTGGRQLEELAFEILATTSLSAAAVKAKHLAGRGVRRVFAIDVTKRRVFEWSQQLGSWSILPTNGVIEDRALARPLPVEGLLDTARTDDLVVRAWRARRHAEFLAEREEGREEGRTVGLVEGLRRSLRAVLRARFGELEQTVLERIDVAENEQLERWLVRAAVIDEARALLEEK